MNNYCRHCGNKMNKRANICQNCGTQVIKKRYDSKSHFKYRKLECIFSSIILFIFALRILIIYFEYNSPFLRTVGIVLSILLLLFSAFSKLYLNNSKFINYLFYGVYLGFSIYIILSFIIINNGGF